MRIIPLSEVHEMRDKELIVALRGTITKVYKGKRGTGSTNKPWAIQDLYIKDKSGTELKVSVRDRDNPEDDVPQNWKGKEIIIEAHEGPKGLSGVYCFHDDYTNPPTICARVTATGKIYLADEASAPPRETPAPRQAPPKSDTASKPPANGTGGHNAPQQQKEPPPPPTKEERLAAEERAVQDTKRYLARNANLYNLAIDITAKLIMPHFAKVMGAPMDAAQVQGTIGTMYIGAQRTNHDIGLPVRSLADMNKPQRPPAAPPPPPKPVSPPDDEEIPF